MPRSVSTLLADKILENSGRRYTIRGIRLPRIDSEEWQKAGEAE